jgi:hypothetical protein
MQEYNQNDLLSLSEEVMGSGFSKLTFQYIPYTEDAAAALNFHLSKREKIDIGMAVNNLNNQQAFTAFSKLIKKPSAQAMK